MYVCSERLEVQEIHDQSVSTLPASFALETKCTAVGWLASTLCGKRWYYSTPHAFPTLRGTCGSLAVSTGLTTKRWKGTGRKGRCRCRCKRRTPPSRWKAFAEGMYDMYMLHVQQVAFVFCVFIERLPVFFFGLLFICIPC